MSLLIIARVNSDTEEILKELVSERIRRNDRITGTVAVREYNSRK